METFRNQIFLVTEGLSPQNVLDYFYESPFYQNCGGPSSLNELERQGQRPADGSQPAEWFELVYSNAEGKSGFVDESIFVIQKFQRSHVAKRIPRDVFFVISGTVAAAPTLGLALERTAAHAAVNFAEIFRLARDARLHAKPLQPSEPSSDWPDFVVFEEPPQIEIAQVSLALKDEINNK